MWPIGYYLTCDDAVCDDCFDPGSWEGFEDWDEPLAIFADTESDTPTHCVRCHALIPHELTTEGYRYVREAVAEGSNRLGMSERDYRYRQSILDAWAEEYADGQSVF